MTVAHKLEMILCFLFEREKSTGWRCRIFSLHSSKKNWKIVIVWCRFFRFKNKRFFKEKNIRKTESLIHIWLPFTSHYDLSHKYYIYWHFKMWTLISTRIYFFNSCFSLQASAQQLTLENMRHGPQVQLSMSLLFEMLKDGQVQSISI